MWFLFALISAFLLGCYDVFKKVSLRGNAVIPVLWCNTLFCALFFLPVIVCSHVGIICDDSTFYVGSHSFQAQGLVMLKAVIVLSSWICGYYGIKYLPLTIVGPINATRPVLTLIGAIVVFGERLNLWQWVGVLTAIVAFWLLKRSGKKEGISFADNRWVILLLLAAVLGAVSGLYDKFLLAPVEQGGMALSHLFVQSWYNLYQFILMTVITLILWMPHRKKGTPFAWRYSILFISLFLTMADMSYFYALNQSGALIAIVSMTRRSSVLVSFAFGALFLRERNVRSKFFDLLLVLFSLICLCIGAMS